MLFIIVVIGLFFLLMAVGVIGTVGTVAAISDAAHRTNAPDAQPPATNDYTNTSAPAPESPAVAPSQTNEQPGTVTPTPSPAIPQAITLTDADYRGTSDTNFAKDWVIVNGEKLDGIMAVNPAPNAIVVILYSAGNKNVPASKLPQGFLDAWKLTPERLKAAGNQ
ncbi:MAG: hypothetical protein LV479_05145 [Methylacidiphilales bacterium]|nr:hypothetical protein [Candidatus Methylacidiphilales bacterium]